jgi:hypothetical protein
MNKVDICHAVTAGLTRDGQTLFSIKDFIVTGPQKALQALIVELLSTTGPVETGTLSFLDSLGKNVFRDKATVANYFALFIGPALRRIDDATRPDTERLSTVTLEDFFITEPDSIGITLAVTSLDGKTFKYEIPVRL